MTADALANIADCTLLNVAQYRAGGEMKNECKASAEEVKAAKEAGAKLKWGALKSLSMGPFKRGAGTESCRPGA